MPTRDDGDEKLYKIPVEAHHVSVLVLDWLKALD